MSEFYSTVAHPSHLWQTHSVAVCSSTQSHFEWKVSSASFPAGTLSPGVAVTADVITGQIKRCDGNDVHISVTAFGRSQLCEFEERKCLYCVSVT